MVASANWNYPTAIRFGAGRIDELADACAKAGIARPLFVTDPGLRGLPITSRALGVLDAAGLRAEIFSDVQPNPTEANVAAGLAVLRDGGHDGVVAFGGGSALDCGQGHRLHARADAGRCGTSRTSATGGRGPTRRGSRRSSRCRPRRGRVRRSGGPG